MRIVVVQAMITRAPARDPLDSGFGVPGNLPPVALLLLGAIHDRSSAGA